MSTLVCVPFDEFTGADEFLVKVHKYQAFLADNQVSHPHPIDELDNACIITCDEHKHLAVKYNHKIYSGGLVGADFWDVLLSNLLAAPSFKLVKHPRLPLQLALFNDTLFLEKLAPCLISQRSCLLFLVRHIHTQSLFNTLIAMGVESVCTQLSESDEVKIQQAVNLRLSAQLAAQEA